VVLRLRVQQIDRTDGTSGQWFARAHIVTGAGAEDDFDPGTILLSPDCPSSSELIAQADRMIRELEVIKAKALTMAWNSVAERKAKGLADRPSN